MQKILNTCAYLGAMLLRLLLLPWAKMRFRGKKVWLVCERGNDARDNGYHMFRYLRTQHPEIEAWYLITPDSADLPKIADLGNVLFPRSLDHWLVYLSAEKIVTAFEPHFCPSDSHAFYRFMRRRQKIVFLQHGVIAHDFPLYHKDRSGFDLFICGAKPEYDYVSAHFGYDKGEVRYTGLARFDALHDCEVKKQVLIMPTYRKWLRDMPDAEVANSNYVRTWQALLENPRLSALAERYGVDVVFYPHQLAQKYLEHFSSPSPRICLADHKRFDVQPLLKSSALLITDFSSVHFDFAYMNKPLIYYQFDAEEVFQKHYAPGYFQTDTMGFGEMVTDAETLLDVLESYLATGCQEKPLYRGRIEGFFPLHDTQNCARITQEILSLDK